MAYGANSSYKCEENKFFDDEFIVLFPMKDIEAITSIDDKIKTYPVFKSQMVIIYVLFFSINRNKCTLFVLQRAFIKTIGGSDTKILQNVCCTDYLQMNCQQNVHGQALNQISDWKI